MLKETNPLRERDPTIPIRVHLGHKPLRELGPEDSHELLLGKSRGPVGVEDAEELLGTVMDGPIQFN